MTKGNLKQQRKLLHNTIPTSTPVCSSLLGPVSISDKTSYRKISRSLGSCEIGSLNYRITLKFDRHFGSIAAEVPVKFQSDCTILNINLAASSLCGILQKGVLSDIETEPWSVMQTRLNLCHAEFILYISYHFSTLRCHIKLKCFIIWRQGPIYHVSIISLLQSCWWPGDARRQCIRKHSIEPIFMGYSGFTIRRVDTYRPEQNGCYFFVNIFKCIVLKEIRGSQ